MPLTQRGIMSIGGDLEEETQKRINGTFAVLDRKISQLSRARGLYPSQVRVMQPLHICVLVDSRDVMDDVPFDLRHLRCIVYDYTPRGTRNLEGNLTSTVLQILKRRRS